MKTAILISALMTILQFLGVRAVLETVAAGVALGLSYKLLTSHAQSVLKSCGGRIW
jgi:hypothetical protein